MKFYLVRIHGLSPQNKLSFRWTAVCARDALDAAREFAMWRKPLSGTNNYPAVPAQHLDVVPQLSAPGVFGGFQLNSKLGPCKSNPLTFASDIWDWAAQTEVRL